MQWALVAGIVLAFILVPFVLWEGRMNEWTERWIGSAPSLSYALIIVGLLTIDIVLPVPSSLVSTAAGATLGFFPGVVASTIGLTLSCLFGYVLGRSGGRLIVRRLVGDKDLETVAAHFQTKGYWTLIVMRPVPVLAEGSVLVAGVMRMNPKTFSSVTLLGNVGISLVYCAVGAAALETGSFLLAFAGAVIVPALAMRLIEPRA